MTRIDVVMYVTQDMSRLEKPRLKVQLMNARLFCFESVPVHRTVEGNRVAGSPAKAR